MNVDQATGLCGGVEVASGAERRLVRRACAKCGSRPRAIRSRVSVVVEAVEPQHDHAPADGVGACGPQPGDASEGAPHRAR